MTTKNIHIQGWWPDSLHAWFNQELARTDLAKTDRDRLERLASDDRMMPVATRLAKEERRWLGPGAVDMPVIEKLGRLWLEHADEELGSFPTEKMKPLTIFMARAWNAPVLWRSLKKNRRSKPASINRRKQLAKLKKACDHLCKLLEIHEDVATPTIVAHLYGRDGSPLCGRDGSPRQKYLALISTIRAVAAQAGSEYEVDWVGELDTVLPGKMKDEDAEGAFCIRYIVNDAIGFFGKPLYAEVAILVTTLLGLDTDVPKDRVKDLWDSRKRGDYHEVVH